MHLRYPKTVSAFSPHPALPPFFSPSHIIAFFYLKSYHHIRYQHLQKSRRTMFRASSRRRFGSLRPSVEYIPSDSVPTDRPACTTDFVPYPENGRSDSAPASSSSSGGGTDKVRANAFRQTNESSDGRGGGSFVTLLRNPPSTFAAQQTLNAARLQLRAQMREGSQSFPEIDQDGNVVAIRMQPSH